MKERTERPSDEWVVALVAYINGTLDAEERADVDATLATSADLRRELDELQLIRRAVRRDDAPPRIPGAVWDRVVTPEPGLGPWPPPASGANAPSIGDGVVALAARRRRQLSTVAAAAAAVVIVVAGAAVIAGRDRAPGGQLAETVSTPSGAPAASPNALDAPPPQALMSTEAAMSTARTAVLDVSGSGVATFDGSLVGQEGTAEVVLEVSGAGAVDFGDGSPRSSAYRLRIAVEAVSGPELARPDDFESETIVVDGREYTSDDGGPYTEEAAGVEPGDQGLFAQIALGPDVLAQLPELADGPIDDLGVERLDAVRVRHLRFDITPSPGEDMDRQNADVWIDDTGLVHKLRVTQSGALDLSPIDDGQIQMVVDIDLGEFGAPVEISAPS